MNDVFIFNITPDRMRIEKANTHLIVNYYKMLKSFTVILSFIASILISISESENRCFEYIQTSTLVYFKFL